jgi:type II secretory pathway component PulF
MSNFSDFLIVFSCWVIFYLLPGAVASVVLHYLLSLPMRRRDRALFFLDLVETVVDRGQQVEHAILAAAANPDRSIGARFFMVAAHLENGARLGEALERVPSFLPPQVNAIIQAGEKLGDLKKVLPACREVLRVGPDTVRTTMHYMVAILLLFAPIAVWLISIVSLFVIPKFKDIAGGFSISVWPLAGFIFKIAPYLIDFEVALFFVLLAVTAVYIGGPGFTRFFRTRTFPVVDWIVWTIPWKRKQLLRAFSAMLAALLDGGLPEAEAVRLAGEATANEIGRQHAQRVIAALQGGAKLVDAIRAFDDNGELHWRLSNAVHARHDFLGALRGWHAALDAKAFQQEETATHILASGLVILNGIVVGLVVVGMFGMLVMLLKATLAAT